MALSETIGIDLGTAPLAGELAAEAAAAGARIARVRIALHSRPTVDEALLDTASDAIGALRSAGLGVVAVIDGDLTVAPGGAGAFDPAAPDALAAAWTDELADNAARLAHRLGSAVSAWEILPAPNVGSTARIAPSRWAAMLASVAAAVRPAGNATILAGALVSDEQDDGVAYLHEAYRAGGEDGAWPDGTPPFDGLSIRLAVLPDGGASGDDVSAVLAERTRRLWRVVENLEGTEEAMRRGIYVTGVGWSADRCGEDVQGRNAWTALDTLTSDPVVRAVIWAGLLDDPEGAFGLFRGASAAEETRRPAWRAFKDFSLYAQQIGAAPSILVPGLEGQPAEEAPPPAPAAPEPDGAIEPEPEAVPTPALGTERTVTFRIPDAAALLAAQGLSGPELEAALAAVVAKYGGYEWLPPGEYSVTVPAEPGGRGAESPITNQQVISALYRAGGGTWAVLDKSGLLLSELASKRDEAYSGPAIEELGTLSEEELAAFEREMRIVRSES